MEFLNWCLSDALNWCLSHFSIKVNKGKGSLKLLPSDLAFKGVDWGNRSATSSSSSDAVWILSAIGCWLFDNKFWKNLSSSDFTWYSDFTGGVDASGGDALSVVSLLWSNRRFI